MSFDPKYVRFDPKQLFVDPHACAGGFGVSGLRTCTSSWRGGGGWRGGGSHFKDKASGQTHLSQQPEDCKTRGKLKRRQATAWNDAGAGLLGSAALAVDLARGFELHSVCNVFCSACF